MKCPRCDQEMEYYTPAQNAPYFTSYYRCLTCKIIKYVGRDHHE